MKSSWLTAALPDTCCSCDLCSQCYWWRWWTGRDHSAALHLPYITNWQALLRECAEGLCMELLWCRANQPEPIAAFRLVIMKHWVTGWLGGSSTTPTVCIYLLLFAGNYFCLFVYDNIWSHLKIYFIPERNYFSVPRILLYLLRLNCASKSNKLHKIRKLKQFNSQAGYIVKHTWQKLLADSTPPSHMRGFMVFSTPWFTRQDFMHMWVPMC